MNEVPQYLKNGDDVYIIYSESKTWLVAYNLGLLRLESPDADPLDPDSWTKEGSVFQGAGNVYGAGHASFTRSPDGSENWIAYHTKRSPDPGWGRNIHMQRSEERRVGKGEDGCRWT